MSKMADDEDQSTSNPTGRRSRVLQSLARKLNACCDCSIKCSIITFPIFTIAAGLIGILQLVRRKPANTSATIDNSTLSDLSNSNIVTVPSPSRSSGMVEDEDSMAGYGIMFLVMALVSLALIFIGRCITSRTPGEPAAECRFDRDTGMRLHI